MEAAAALPTGVAWRVATAKERLLVAERGALGCHGWFLVEWRGTGRGVSGGVGWPTRAYPRITHKLFLITHVERLVFPPFRWFFLGPIPAPLGGSSETNSGSMEEWRDPCQELAWGGPRRNRFSG